MLVEATVAFRELECMDDPVLLTAFCNDVQSCLPQFNKAQLAQVSQQSGLDPVPPHHMTQLTHQRLGFGQGCPCTVGTICMRPKFAPSSPKYTKCALQ